MNKFFFLPLCMALTMPVWGQLKEQGAKVAIKSGDGISIATPDGKYSINIKSNFSGYNHRVDALTSYNCWQFGALLEVSL